ncbi:MAG TPA: CBS domain-containing protein [Acidimicrobiales bacterium]
MQLRDVPVREFMTTDVLTFRRDDNVQYAMRTLVTRDIDAAPVIDDEGYVIGSLSTGDLIVEEARIPLPAMITLLGAVMELPRSRKKYEHDLDKALGASVGEVMQEGVLATLSLDDTLETAATLLHDEDLDRIPVVDADGVLVGLVSRGDIVRAIIRDLDAATAADQTGDSE